MKANNQRFLLAIVVLIVLWLVFNRLCMRVWMCVTGWQSLVTFGVVALVIFLVLEHLVNRDR